MFGLSVRLPLVYGNNDGPYILNKDILSVARQNLKNLILTSPGERIMIPEFGVGIKGYFFQQINGDTFSELSTDINDQVSRYMPFINIEEIRFVTSEDNSSLAFNEVGVSIKFNLGALPYTDILTITSSDV